MIDVYFIEFYIFKKHNQKLEDYYEVTKAVSSRWRKHNFPERRLKEFLYREETINIHELIDKIY